MSKILINTYLRQLEMIRKISGSSRETIIREAFKDLLKAWGKQFNLVFLAEYPMKTASNKNIILDGALLHELRMPLGYWEAKDKDDDLTAELVKKFYKGYPQDNIVFTDDVLAVLWQNGQEKIRCDMSNTEALKVLLDLFFGYERPEISNFRSAVEQFKTDLPEVLNTLTAMIEDNHKNSEVFQRAEAKFLAHAQDVINPVLTYQDVHEMLIQHILTEEIFSKVFNDSDFHRKNNVAKELYALEDNFFNGNLKKQTLKGLETYYSAINSAAAQISSHSEKQTFLKVIYENFYKIYNPMAAEKLGVVYTPNEIVRFMIQSIDLLTEKYFGKSLIDEGIEILDPATGTGTFVCELLEHFRGQPAKLKHKYLNEIYANEVAILPYYVANLNIEATYAAITGDYEEFQNLCFVDTLDNVGLHTATKGTIDDLFGGVSEENVERIKRQNSRKINIVVGNPPYRANQKSDNDNNKNRTYPVIDKSIKDSYIALSNAQKSKSYDMLMRFYRWATNRLGDEGIVAFITNRSFIDKGTHDGFRKSIENEFSHVFVVDLGGAMLDGDAEGNVFGITVGVAITFFIRIKNRDVKKKATVSIASVTKGNAEERLSTLANKSFSEMQFNNIKPDEEGNWIQLISNGFDELLPTHGDKSKGIFETGTLGISTNRDEWVVGRSKNSVSKKVKYFLSMYSKHRSNGKVFDTTIKWSDTLKIKLKAKRAEAFNLRKIESYLYRPFDSINFYNSALLIDRPGKQREFFCEEAQIQNQQCFLFTGPGSQRPFMAFASNKPFDLHVVGSAAGAIGIPLLNADKGITVSNITNWALKQFQQYYAKTSHKEKPITDKAIFSYCYAVLHDPIYREKYVENLKRSLPRYPFYDDFWLWSAWGEDLLDTHINYIAQDPWEMKRVDVKDNKAIAAGLDPRPLFKGDREAGTLVIDSETTLSNLPTELWDYVLGTRSAIDWIIVQYKPGKKDLNNKADELEDYNFAKNKEDLIKTISKVATVSFKTLEIIRKMAAATR